MTKWFRRRSAAEFLRAKYDLRVTDGSLATAATRGGGPRMRKQGRYAYYLEQDLDEWAASRCSEPMDSTSSPIIRCNGRGLFVYHEDRGDLPPGSFDRFNTGDPYFDEVTKLLAEQGIG